MRQTREAWEASLFAGPALPFAVPQTLPTRVAPVLGLQMPKWQAGGPSGFPGGTAGAIKPWPYRVPGINFVVPVQYGAASTLAPIWPRPYSTGINPITLQGFVKMPTYANVIW